MVKRVMFVMVLSGRLKTQPRRGKAAQPACAARQSSRYRGDGSNEEENAVVNRATRPSSAVLDVFSVLQDLSREESGRFDVSKMFCYRLYPVCFAESGRAGGRRITNMRYMGVRAISAAALC